MPNSSVTQLEMLLEVSQSLARTSDMRQALLHTLEIVERATGAQSAAIAFLQESTGEIAVDASIGLVVDGHGAPLRPGEGITGKVVASGESIVLPKVQGEAALFVRGEGHADAADSSLVSVPVFGAERAMGALDVLLPYEPERDLQDTARLLGIVASMVAQRIRLDRRDSPPPVASLVSAPVPAPVPAPIPAPPPAPRSAPRAGTGAPPKAAPSYRPGTGRTNPPPRSLRSIPDVGHVVPGETPHGAKLGAITLAALGIVFGDIGTSPLYTLRECVTSAAGHGKAPQPEDILGILSLIVWSLTLVVAVKYLGFVMKADNRGEGGILALLALVPEKIRSPGGRRIGWVTILVLIGTALLYGDGVITPAISVLSAVEGLEVVTDSMKPAVVPITCVILMGLFAIQQHGTASVGRFFGPIILVWFTALLGMGAYHVVHHPGVLMALSPHYAVHFFQHHGLHGVAVLGSVVLAVTGGEALYADMGHFGARPIRLAWWGLVMPGLVANYFGQGALLLEHPEALENPFFTQVPNGVLRYGLVGLSTLASIIASQALISGAYSLTHQAVQLGYFPRVTVKHTSHETEGQIYIPQINWGLFVACLLVVLQFRTSSSLAAAYGIAVTGTMGITSIIYYVVVRRTWGWAAWKVVPLVGLFLCFDVAFFGANLLKFFDGGYFPILIGGAVFFCMLTWRIGRSLLAEYIVQRSPPMDEFLVGLDERLVSRTPGTGVFMASNSGRVPPILFHHAQRIRVLNETVILLTVITEHTPTAEEDRRLEVKDLGSGVYRVIARCGFMEAPNVPDLLQEAAGLRGLPADFSHITYYVGRETFLATGSGKMGKWSEMLFAFLSRNAQPATRYFGIPPDQVVELGTQIDL